MAGGLPLLSGPAARVPAAAPPARPPSLKPGLGGVAHPGRAPGRPLPHPTAAFNFFGRGRQPDAGSSPEQAAAAEEAASPSTASGLPAAVLRKASAAADASEALDVLLAEVGGASGLPLDEAACRDLMALALERGNAALAQSLFRAMTAAAAGVAPGLASSDGGAGGGGAPPGAAASWPPATVDTAGALVVGLARALLTREAVAVIGSVRSRGLPTSEDVQFGFVVGCPADASLPLAVVQPQEGSKPVADSYSRYEYELFSGTVVSAASESLVTEQSWAMAAARRVGLLRRPAAGASHTVTVQTPAGQQRTFRFGTATADVPAKVGDRASFVCAPQEARFSQRRLLSAAQPGTKPGEALSVSNHTTRGSTPLLRPPAPGAGGVPAWALPLAVVLAGSDAASSLIDPALPYLIAGAAAAAAASGVAGATVLLPRLKQLPAAALEVQASRQKLLGQHSALEGRIRELVEGASEDVMVLARLWQLQNKMAAAGGAAAYDARLERVVGAREAVEGRLASRIGAVDAYARVISMIEIEVEMDAELPDAEVLGIEEQIARLAEVEELQAEWQLQAEAANEVEKLLRATS